MERSRVRMCVVVVVVVVAAIIVIRADLTCHVTWPGTRTAISVARSIEGMRDRDAWEMPIWRHSLRSNDSGGSSIVVISCLSTAAADRPDRHRTRQANIETISCCLNVDFTGI